MKYLVTLICFFGLLSCSQPTTKRITSDQSITVHKKVYYDGVDDDLLTAGLGLSGLRGSAPELSDSPSASDLRGASYYHQFKALNDLSKNGGFGDLYGFNETQAAIAGYEFWSQRQVVPLAFHTVVLQIPDNFNPNKACLVVAPSSGSRNALGAVGTSGVWALTHDCAVVYSDKGTGTQIVLTDNQSYQIDGIISHAKTAVTLNEASILSGINGNHVVQKHPYSQVNPEQYWGDFVLDAATYGLGLLHQEKHLNRQQVKVIAASISNGGGAVLRAAETDVNGLIDAVVAAEPQINLAHQYELLQAQQTTLIKTKPLLELSMNLSLYEPCAALDQSLNTSPFKMNTLLIQPAMQARCQILTDDLLLEGDDLSEQSQNALNKMQQIHITNEAMKLSQLNTLANMWGSINHTYSNSYLQKSVSDNLCQSAMSAFTANGEPRALTRSEMSRMFALSNGIAPSNGVELAFTDEANQVQSRMSFAPQFGYQSQLCFYQLLAESELQSAFKSIQAEPYRNVRPTVILHGQADGTVAINHASRAYYHQNQSSESENEKLRYYEIENVQHFDAFLAYPGFNQQFVPMHPYFEQALDLMYEYLFDDRPLPPSQLIKTKVRGLINGQVPALNESNIPAISMYPEYQIMVNQQQLEIE